MKRVPKAEYERRLRRLEKALYHYRIFGNDYDLHPALFSLFAYLWFKNNDDLTKLDKDGLFA